MENIPFVCVNCGAVAQIVYAMRKNLIKILVFTIFNKKFHNFLASHKRMQAIHKICPKKPSPPECSINSKNVWLSIAFDHFVS